MLMRNIITMILLLLTVQARSQITVTGVVIDEGGKPIPYATVLVKHSRKGTWTDDAGRYKLNEIFSRDTLICSHALYNSVARAVEDNEKLSFILPIAEQQPLRVYVNKRFEYIKYKTPDSTAKQKKEAAQKRNPENRMSDEDEIFTKVEIAPNFGAPADKVARYLANHIELPDTLETYWKHNENMGITDAMFTTDITGKIKDVIILNSFSPQIDKALTDAIMKLPFSDGGQQNGHRIEGRRRITFMLNYDVIRRVE